jgi:hypothetical protein
MKPQKLPSESSPHGPIPAASSLLSPMNIINPNLHIPGQKYTNADDGIHIWRTSSECGMLCDML